MPKSAFITLIFSLLFLMHSIYFYTNLSFEDETKALSQKLNLKEKELDQEKLRNELAFYQIKNFKEEVASVLKENLPNKKSLTSKANLRTFASLVSHVDENKLEEQMSKNLFYQAKAKYKNKKYSEAVNLLKEFIKENSLSPQVIEAHYLLVESFYSLNQLEDCIKTSKLMVKLFPDNDFTGFAILRMGKLYQEQKRTKEAIEVFEMIPLHFSNKKLNTLVKEALDNIKT